MATLVVVILSGTLVVLFAWVWLDDMSKESHASHHAREIVTCLKIWANDNEGKYPDSKLGERATSNMAFRELYISDYVQDEGIFGAPRSRFVPDGKLGSAPGYAQTLEPGENHWMLLAGLSTKSPGRTPLFFENALDTSWPPKWLPGFFMHHVRGRSWRGKKILVCFNDSSAMMAPLMRQGDFMTLADDILRDLPPMKVLDIEERP